MRRRGETSGEAAGIDRMQAVDVFRRIDRRDHLLGVEAFGSGNCTRMPCTARSASSFWTVASNSSCETSAGQPMLERGHACRHRLAMLAADINLARRIVADQHHGKPRGDVVIALQPRTPRPSPCRAARLRSPCRRSPLPSCRAVLSLVLRSQAAASLSPRACASPEISTRFGRAVAPMKFAPTPAVRAAFFASSLVTARLLRRRRRRPGPEPSAPPAITQSFDPVDRVAAAARRHAQENSHPTDGRPPRLHLTSPAER